MAEMDTWSWIFAENFNNFFKFRVGMGRGQ